MYVSEILDAIRWVEANVVATRAPDLYNALAGVLEANAQPNAQQPFESQKTELVNAIKSISTVGLTEDQVAFLRELNIAQHVGQEGVDRLEEILVRNPVDVATAAAKVRAITKEIQRGVKRLNAIKEALVEVPIPAPREVQPGEVLLRVKFKDDAAINNVVDLKEWSRIWHDIARGIAMLHDAAPEDIRVVGAATGSIIVDLVAAYVIAKTATAILLESLKVADRVLDIRLKAQQVRALKLDNDKAALEIEQAAEKEREKRIATIVATVSASAAQIDGEKTNALTKSVENLVTFIEKGGQVDCTMPSAPEGAAEHAEIEEKRQVLLTTFAEIRELETKVARIEHTLRD